MFDNSPSLRSEMGFDEERFFSIISDAVKCSLCQGILDNPVKTTCGHVFCSGCILSWLVRYRACPYGCGELTPSDIQNDLELREFICNMKVHCKYQKLGCNEKVRLMDLEYHTECCEFKDALSNEDDNREADEKSKDSGNQNENKECLYHQAVSICQKGCGLLLHHNRLENHDCFVSLRAYIAEQENRMNTIETEMKQLASTATRKEKFLLTQVVNLHNKLQTEALRYKRKLGDYRSQLDNECRQNANRTYQTSDFENITQITFQVVLERQNNSLGFNIMGGYTPEQNNNKRSESDEDLSGGVTVSRVTKGSPASKSGLQKDDQVIKVGQDN